MTRKHRRRKRPWRGVRHLHIGEESLKYEPSVARALEANMQQYLNVVNPKCPTESGASYEMNKLLALYRHWRRLRRPIAVNDHNLLETMPYNLAYLCYKWQVEDSFVVSEVLTLMYELFGHFMMLFQKSLRHPASFADRWMITSFKTTEIPGLPPFAYFVHHATVAALTFHGVRFIDMRLCHPNGYRPSPTYLAASHGQIKMLQYLLQYGAFLMSPSQNNPWVASLIVKLLANALRAGAIETILTAEDRDHLLNYKTQKGGVELQCVRLLLRAVPLMKLKCIKFFSNNTCRKFFPNCVEFLRTMSRNPLISGLEQRFLEPPTLKHACRVVIREKLRENWQLPHGIRTLSLPITLNEYLDLNED